MTDRAIQIALLALTIVAVTVALPIRDRYAKWRPLGYVAGGFFLLVAAITYLWPSTEIAQPNGPTITAHGNGNCYVAGTGNHVSCAPKLPPAPAIKAPPAKASLPERPNNHVPQLAARRSNRTNTRKPCSAGDRNTVIGNVPCHLGSDNTFVRDADPNGNVVHNGTEAIGSGAHAGPGTVAIGAGAGAGTAAPPCNVTSTNQSGGVTACKIDTVNQGSLSK